MYRLYHPRLPLRSNKYNGVMITVAIQAGGQSRRMGRDKALVKLGGRPLIEHVLERARDLGDDFLVTTNRPEPLEYLGLRLVPDLIPGAGALNGLETALRAAYGTHILLLACDAPFVSRRLLEHLIDKREQGDVIIPEHAGRFEPLQALYDCSACLPAVQQATRTGKKRMISFFPDVNVHSVSGKTLSRLDPAGVSFFNINTPADLRQAETTLHRLERSEI